ncbi:MAG: EF-hand domain-containing protein [Silicimonas sp.]
MRYAAAAFAFAISASGALAGASIGAIDANGDRFVSYNELVAHVPNATHSEFRAADVNGDRRLSANEFAGSRAQSLVARLDTRAPDRNKRLLTLSPASLAEIDSDHDGRVTFDELIRADTPAFNPLRGN